jgi:aminoglycoside phosphotransferase (APT) family kinase protein
MPLLSQIYFLGRTYVLQTRIKGRQVKRSLKNADRRTAKLVGVLARLRHLPGQFGCLERASSVLAKSATSPPWA